MRSTPVAGFGGASFGLENTAFGGQGSQSWRFGGFWGWKFGWGRRL